MKNFTKFAKFIMYMLIGGLLAFVVCTVGLLAKANSIAGNVAREVCIVASNEGCINEDVATPLIEAINNGYESEFIVIGNSFENVIQITSDDDNYSLYNPTDNTAYNNHVQRGEIIKVKATVNARLHFNFLFGGGEDQGGLKDFEIPVTREVTSISSKWFKGE